DSHRIDTVVIGMCAEEFHERDLTSEIESNDEAIVTAGDLESYALSIQYFCFGNSLPHILHGLPARGFCQPIPTLQRSCCLGMLSREFDQHASGNHAHGMV